MATIVRVGGGMNVGTPVTKSRTDSSYSSSAAYHYTDVIDTGNNNTKAVFVSGAHSGGAKNGIAQGSNNNSSWTDITTTGFYTYRYYRGRTQEDSESNSAISYAYVGVLDLGYVKS